MLGALPGDTNSFAFDVNDSGQVVGSSQRVGNQFTNPRTFIWQAGVFTDLGVPSGYIGNSPYAINSHGDVVGFLFNASSRTAFLYRNGQFITLNSLLPAGSGWILTEARDVNDADQIVGLGYLDGVAHGFLYSNGSITDLGPDFAYWQAINNPGQVAGGHFLWTNGTVIDLKGFTPPPGYYNDPNRINAFDINDLGQVVGYAGLPDPIPEPNSVFLISSGLGLLFIASRRSRIRCLALSRAYPVRSTQRM